MLASLEVKLEAEAQQKDPKGLRPGPGEQETPTQPWETLDQGRSLCTETTAEHALRGQRRAGQDRISNQILTPHRGQGPERLPRRRKQQDEGCDSPLPARCYL